MGLSAKGLRSTLVSAAMITTSAPAMSAGVSLFSAPTAPCVSTLIVSPCSCAARCNS